MCYAYMLIYTFTCAVTFIECHGRMFRLLLILYVMVLLGVICKLSISPTIAGMAPWWWHHLEVFFGGLRFRERFRRFRQFQGCFISAVCYKWWLGHWPPLSHITSYHLPSTFSCPKAPLRAEIPKAPRRTVAETLATSLAPELPGDLPAELLDEELPLATEVEGAGVEGERYPGRWMNFFN